MTKKILLYGINFTPELTGIGKYTGEMAAWLAARGHDVRVVTAALLPCLADWQRIQRRSLRAGGVAWRAGVAFAAVGAPSGLKRLLHLASFGLCSLPVMLRQIVWRPDVVWVVEPALFCAPTAVVVARLSGAKAWQLQKLQAASQRAQAQDPQGFESNAHVKLFNALSQLMLETVPSDPNREEYRQGNTMGPAFRHWRRAKIGRRFRLFFRFDSKTKIIIFAWVALVSASKSQWA